jgi:hypothetical protein
MTSIATPDDEETVAKHEGCPSATDDRVMLFVPVDGPPLNVAANTETRAPLRDAESGGRGTRPSRRHAA